MKRCVLLGAIFIAVGLLFCLLPAYAADFTFECAWQKLLSSCDTLAAWRSATDRQKHLRQAAAMRHFPSYQCVWQLYSPFKTIDR